ncbi:hypothetical protein ACP275_14G201600 [Erythranthe tilingii]
MGIVHSIIRFLGDKFFNLYTLLSRKSVTELFQKVRYNFRFRRPRKPPHHPILPIHQHPNPDPDPDPVQGTLIPISLPTGNYCDEESQCSDNNNVYPVPPHEQRPPPASTMSAAGEEIPGHHVILPVPDYFSTHSHANTVAIDGIILMGSAFFLEEIAPQNEEEEEEEVVVVKSRAAAAVDDGGGRWIKHYSSRHRILVVGDGDFSFSTSLAVAFGSASNMIATSLNSISFLNENYANAASNIEELTSRGCVVMHGIDATKMANHPLIGHLNFDRVIFNFPFAGFFKNLSRESQLRRHRRLVNLFMKNAKEMISSGGEIHISHKTNGFHIEWNLESIGSSHGLRLIEAVKFNHREYPGYNTKCGFGGDNIFNCNPSRTYKFGLIN